jgi:hypothetical protein
MKSIFAKLDYSSVFAPCLVARLLIAWALHSPWTFGIIAGTYSLLILVQFVPVIFRKFSKIAAGTKIL